MAFFHGLNEPTEGLLAQPVRSLLTSWGDDAARIATFSALLALPWSIKPLFGLITDFIPLAGMRRKSYLALTSAVSAACFLGLFFWPVRAGGTFALLVWLIVPTAAVAFADVSADALLVETGQARGLTGQLQAVQWGCSYGSGILIGLIGGDLSERHLERWAFLICGIEGAGDVGRRLGLCPRTQSRHFGSEAGCQLSAPGPRIRSPTLVSVAGFLFLWNFNPFSNAVLHVHMTRGMGMSERFYGQTLSLSAVASIAACLAYGGYCRRVPMTVLVHLSIALGVVSTLGYMLMEGERSAVVVTVAIGFTYMTATLIQLDLAARTCPAEVAGTIFALLMSLENLATSLSTWLGGLVWSG